MLRILRFYIDGFREMSWSGRSLWVLIVIKLVFVFVILKFIFFPDLLQRDYPDDASRAAAVRHSLAQPRE